MTKRNEKVESNSRKDNPDGTTKLSILSVCPVRLTCSSKGFYVKAELLPPWNSQSSDLLRFDSSSEGKSFCTDDSYSD